MNSETKLETMHIRPRCLDVFAKWCGRLRDGEWRGASETTRVEVWVHQSGALRLRQPDEGLNGWLKLEVKHPGAFNEAGSVWGGELVHLTYKQNIVAVARNSDADHVIAAEGVVTLDALCARYEGELPTDEERSAAASAFQGPWAQGSTSTHPELVNLDAVVKAAQELRDNWFEGAVAQAHYRNKLVDTMVDAGLLAGGSREAQVAAAAAYDSESREG